VLALAEAALSEALTLPAVSDGPSVGVELATLSVGCVTVTPGLSGGSAALAGISVCWPA
jgi:hypothetical protein